MKPRAHGGGAESERWRIMFHCLSPYLLFSTIWSAIIKAVIFALLLFQSSSQPHFLIMEFFLSFSPDADLITNLPSGELNCLIYQMKLNYFTYDEPDSI